MKLSLLAIAFGGALSLRGLGGIGRRESGLGSSIPGMMLNPFRFVLQAVTVLLEDSSWPHYYASQTTHAHRLVAFGCVSSSEGDNFCLGWIVSAALQ
ncbi:hypothetical protein MRX96_034940 [Rhipicephalus microplus]